MLVVDAGVLSVALADDGPEGDATRGRLRGETLDAVLLTGDRRLARAAGPICTIELFRSPR